MSELSRSINASKAMNFPPGPRGSLLLGSLPERQKNPISLLVRSAHQYGDLVRLRLGPLQAFLVNRPEYIKHILQDRQDNYRKGWGYRKLYPMLGLGLLTSEGDFWRRQRKLAQPAFHRQRLVAFATTIVRSTTQMLDRWEAKRSAGSLELDVAQELMQLTLGVASQTLLSVDVGTQGKKVGEAFTRALSVVNQRMTSLNPLGEWLPTPRNFRFKRDLAILDETVYGIIRKRRKSPDTIHDLLAMLMELRDEETGESMSDIQLRDEVMTVFLAGHETTASALAWTLGLLSRHPDVERKLRKELDQELPAGSAPSFDQLPRLKYLEAVIKEALRLYPPAWIISRQAISEDFIGGYRIPRGAEMIISPYVIHRHPHYWENPEGFDPERFFGDEAKALQKYTYLPFGGGPRICIGNAFAMMEAQIILAMLLQSFRISLLAGETVVPDPGVTLRPKGGVHVSIHRVERNLA